MRAEGIIEVIVRMVQRVELNTAPQVRVMPVRLDFASRGILLQRHCVLLVGGFGALQREHLTPVSSSPLENVIVKVALLDPTVWENHRAKAMLNSLAPNPLVDAAVDPVHLSVAVALVITIVTLVQISTGPLEDTITVLLVHVVVTLVRVYLPVWHRFLPLALPMLHSILEIAYIGLPVLPLVLSEAVWLTAHVLPRVHVAVRKKVCAVAVLQTVFPFAFVSVAVLPLVHPVAVSFGLLPLAQVRVLVDASPDAVALLSSEHPLAVVRLAVGPGVNSLAVRLVVLEVAFVHVSVLVLLEAAAVALVLLPLAFEDALLADVDHDS